MQVLIDTDTPQGRAVLAAVEAHKARLAAQVDAACKARLLDAEDCPDRAAAKALLATLPDRTVSIARDLIAAAKEIRLSQLEVEMSAIGTAIYRGRGQSGKAQMTLAEGVNALGSLDESIERLEGAIADAEHLSAAGHAALAEVRP